MRETDNPGVMSDRQSLFEIHPWHTRLMVMGLMVIDLIAFIYAATTQHPILFLHMVNLLILIFIYFGTE